MRAVIGWKNCAMFDLFRDLSLASFRSLRVKFRNKRGGRWQQKNQTKICEHDKRRNLRYNVSGDGNP